MITNKQGLSFRGLMPADIALLEKWYSMTDCFGYATGFKNFAEIRQRLIAPSRGHILISMIDTEDGKTIGFVYGEIKAAESKKVLWIYTLIIEPAHQNRGYGTQAVNILLQWARAKYGPLTCVVSVSEKNPRGLAFWEKTGFVRSLGLEGSLSQIGSSGVAILQKNLG
jgi:RimJ/RimL family protein N-acetyltransferase